MKTAKKVKRNEPCPCGSGKKYKKCCIEKSNSDLEVYLVSYIGVVESEFEGTIERTNGDVIKGTFHLKVDLTALIVMNSNDDMEKIELLKANKDNIKTIAKDHRTTDLNEFLEMPGCIISDSTGKRINDVKSIISTRIKSYNISDVELESFTKFDEEPFEDAGNFDITDEEELACQEDYEPFINFFNYTLNNAFILKNGIMMCETEFQYILDREIEYQNQNNGYDDFIKMLDIIDKMGPGPITLWSVIEILKNIAAGFQFHSEKIIERSFINEGAVNYLLSLTQYEENLLDNHCDYLELQDYFSKLFPNKSNQKVSYSFGNGRQLINVGQNHFSKRELKVSREIFRNPDALLKYFNALIYSNEEELLLNPADWIDNCLWNSSKELTKKDMEVNLRFNLSVARKQIKKVFNMKEVKSTYFHKGFTSLKNYLGIRINPQGIMGLSFVPNNSNKDNVRKKLLEQGYRAEFIDYIIRAKNVYFDNVFTSLIEPGKIMKDLLGKENYEELKEATVA